MGPLGRMEWALLLLLLLSIGPETDLMVVFVGAEAAGSRVRQSTTTTTGTPETTRVARDVAYRVSSPEDGMVGVDLIARRRRHPSSSSHHGSRMIRIYRTHNALQFLEPVVTQPPSPTKPKRGILGYPQRKKKNSAPIIPLPPQKNTRVGELAVHFQSVLRTGSDMDNQGRRLAAARATTKTDNNDDELIIDLPCLLAACHRFEKAMVDVEQRLSANDMRKNIAKTEAFSKKQTEQHTSMVRVLQIEKDTNVHDYSGPNGRLHLLKDPSCAMGLLWIRRSLQFQSVLFRTLLEHEKVPAVDAALDAYRVTLLPFHGWALQKVYNIAVTNATPTREIWLARLGGFSVESFGPAEKAATCRDLRTLLSLWDPLLARWVALYAELDLEDQRKV